MFTIILYVQLCINGNCDNYEPASWSVQSQQEIDNAWDECSKQERKWMKVKGYKESDCYIAE